MSRTGLRMVASQGQMTMGRRLLHGLAELTLVLASVTFLVLLTAGLVTYEGNRATYFLFTAAFAGLLLWTLKTTREYAQLFFGLFLFVGFWVKFTYHLLVDVPYPEPSGSFDFTPGSWDEVLWVATVGCLGLLAGRLAVVRVSHRAGSHEASAGQAPKWYAEHRLLCWMALWIVLILVIGANEAFAVLKRGYASAVRLPWPFHGLYAWLTNIGLVIAICTFTYWDASRRKSLRAGLIALFTEAAAVSLTTLSRGIYYFHTVPVLVALSQADKNHPGRVVTRKAQLWIGAGWLACALAVPAATSFVRLYGSDALPTTQQQLDDSVDSPRLRNNSGKPLKVFAIELTAQAITVARILLIDRWIGLEGVMSAVSYEGKGMSLLVEAAAERRSYGDVDIYTETISRSGFNELHAQKYHYATLAGPIAFLYFSGSKIIVFCGMFVVAVALSLLQVAWWRLSKNPYLAAVFGLYIALLALQFGGTVVQTLTVLGATFCAGLLTWVAERGGAGWPLLGALGRSRPSTKVGPG